MNTNKIKKIGIFLNVIEIIISLSIFLLLFVLEIVNAYHPEKLSEENLNNITLICNYVMVISAFLLIIFSTILIIINKKRLNGLGFTLVVAILLLLFGLFGFAPGYVVWVLSAISISQLSKKKI